MTREEAIYKAKHLRKVHPNICVDAEDFWDTVIAALVQEPCDDCISRQAVLDQTYLWSRDEFLRVTNPFDYLRKRINSLPSVTPAEKVGHWIFKSFDPDTGIRNTRWCLECDTPFVGIYKNYCPNCGRKMEDVEG